MKRYLIPLLILTAISAAAITLTNNNINAQHSGGAWQGTGGGGSGISNVVEDTTPQLGGDLDLNGNNIDFPTTANISDVLDEDNMASNSATVLSTQQSIKAYADTKSAITGQVYTGTHDFGGADDLEVPNSATPTVDTAGQIALDTTVSGYDQGLLTHYSTATNYIISIPTANLTTTDNHVIAYDAALNEFNMETAGGGASDIDGLSDAVTTATNNVGLGSTALDSITPTSGNNNVAVGVNAGTAMTTGDNNVCIGFDSGTAITSTIRNTYVGSDAGKSHVGDGNVGIGWQALFSTGGGDLNVAVGEVCMGGAVVSGGSNTGVGDRSLLALTAGAGNVALGASAGDVISTGSDNIFIGHLADADANNADGRYVIGHDVTFGTDTAVAIGNATSHIQALYNTSATWSFSSDLREKRRIEIDELGLKFIEELRAVKYNLKPPSEFPKEWVSYQPDNHKAPSNQVIRGFIAQEVKVALENSGVEDGGMIWSVQSDGRQRISIDAMVIPLVNAVQELSAKVERLELELSVRKKEDDPDYFMRSVNY